MNEEHRTILRRSMDVQERARMLAQDVEVETYPEMDGQIIEILRLCSGEIAFYAARRIEELERQLRGARATVTELRRKDADYRTNRTSTPETGTLGREISPPLAEVGE